MLLTSPSEIEAIILSKTRASKDSFLVEQLIELKQNWRTVIDTSGKTETAYMSHGRTEGYTMAIGADFLKHDLKDEDALFFVYLHELFHMINGDLLRDDTWIWTPKAANVIFDIMINSRILRCHHPEGIGFLADFYGPHRNAMSFLLAPPFTRKELISGSAYSDQAVQERCYRETLAVKLQDEDIITDKQMYAKLRVSAWFGNQSMSNLAAMMKKAMKLDCAQQAKLIGAHNTDGGMPEEYEIDIEEERSIYEKNKALLKAVKKAAEPGSGRLVDCRVTAPQRGVMPAPGRREMLLLSGGVYPFFFPNVLEHEGKDERSVKLYLDVSGSFDRSMPVFYAVLSAVKSWLSDPVYLFSGNVNEVTVSEFTAGKVVTDRGTSFDNMLKHCLKNNFKRVIIVTDGMGSITSKVFRELMDSKIELYLVLTQDFMYDAGAMLRKKAKEYWVVEG